MDQENLEQIEHVLYNQKWLIATAASDLSDFYMYIGYWYVTALVILYYLYTSCDIFHLPLQQVLLAVDVFLSGVDMSESEYSQLHAAMEKLNTEAAKMAENQKSLLSHNAQVVQLVEDFRTVQQNLKKTTSGKPSTPLQPNIWHFTYTSYIHSYRFDDHVIRLIAWDDIVHMQL